MWFLGSILAGMMISFGCIVYLSVGGVVGAALFAVGLLSVIHLKIPLFTGQAGKLATKKITPFELFMILFGNICGTTIMAVFAKYLMNLTISSDAIVASRGGLTLYNAVFLGIGCGVLMYIATSNTSELLSIMCVTAFIMCGFPHCIADGFYYAFSDAVMSPLVYFATIVGNLVGCNIPPLILNTRRSRKKEWSDENSG